MQKWRRGEKSEERGGGSNEAKIVEKEDGGGGRHSVEGFARHECWRGMRGEEGQRERQKRGKERRNDGGREEEGNRRKTRTRAIMRKESGERGTTRVYRVSRRGVSFVAWRGMARRGPRAFCQKEENEGGEGAGRGERRKEETQGEAAVVHVSDYRTALACSNERKSICMIHARESVPKGVDGGGGRGEQDAFARGERKRESERAREGRKKVVRPRERTVRPGAGGSEQRTSLPSTTGFSKRTGDEPPGVTT